MTNQDFQIRQMNPKFLLLFILHCLSKGQVYLLWNLACLVHPMVLSGDDAINCYAAEGVLFLPPWLQCFDPVGVHISDHSTF